MHDTKASRLRVSIFMVFLFATMLAVEPGSVANAQTGCSSPPSNNQYWAPGTPITVYIDPSLPQQVKDGINAAIADWSTQSALTGNNIQMTTTSKDPGDGIQNTVRVLNDPAGSPSNIAFTRTRIVTQNGVPTNQMFSAEQKIVKPAERLSRRRCPSIVPARAGCCGPGSRAADPAGLPG
jgi:hypothetical protein